MSDFNSRYVAARKAVIAQDLKRLNPMQRKAAMTTEGPLLLLAGAGSGKTTVLIQRVYNLLTYGKGSDSNAVPEWATEDDLSFLENFPARMHSRWNELSGCVHLMYLVRGRSLPSLLLTRLPAN